MNAAASPWLTVPEAAARGKVSEKAIYAMCAQGRLRHARLMGRRAIRIKAEWLDEALEASAQPVEVVRRG